jgi:seryl-tRNA synthetase
MSIVKYKDKRTGTTYVYESESYWDKEKKQPRNKRTLIGKIDEVTGEIIPTDGRGRKRKSPVEKDAGKYETLISEYQKQLKEKEAVINHLTAENQQLKKNLSAVLESLHKITDKYDGNI